MATGEYEGPERILTAHDVISAQVALLGLAQALEATRRTQEQIKQAMRVLPREVSAPEGQLFAIYFHPRTGEDAKVFQGIYVPPGIADDGVTLPNMQNPYPVTVNNMPPFHATLIAVSGSGLLAVNSSGSCIEFSQEQQDRVELVPAADITIK